MTRSRQQTYAVVQPDGSIIFEFAGHISADGLDLPGDAAGVGAPDDQRIRWIRTSDGAVVAQVIGGSSANSGSLDLLAENPDGAGQASVQLSGDTLGSRVNLGSNGRGLTALMDSGGLQSAFAMMYGQGVAPTQFIIGLANGGGGQILTYPAGSYTNTRLSVGSYRLNFGGFGFNSVPAIIATPYAVVANEAIIYVNSALAAQAVLQVIDTNTGAAIDANFAFIAVGSTF